MQSTDKQILIIEDNTRCMNKVCQIIKDIEGVIIFKAESSEKAYRYPLEYNIGCKYQTAFFIAVCNYLK